MQTIKPLQLSLLSKSFTWERRHHLAVGILIGFPFEINTEHETLLEQDLWRFLTDVLGKDAMLDMCMPKPQGEVLVYGSYYAPGSKPVTADMVQLRIGDIDKRLSVIGNRYWRTLIGPTAPEPFTEMPIDYEHAFGGKDYKQNPLGKGIEEVEINGETHVPMPNIENPEHLVTSVDHRPDPAGFGPLDLMWEQRTPRMGTYDEKWQQEYFPGYAPDLDWNYFNVAQQDQWIDGFWQGGERFQLLNMHPEKFQLTGHLPGFRARCFVQQEQDDNTVFNEVDMRAESVFLFPDAETGVMLYRGTIETREDDATDISHMILGYENLAQPARSVEHYQQALNNRLDEEQVFKYMMYTKDLIPETERCGFARILEEAGTAEESELSRNLAVRAETEKANALEKKEEVLKEAEDRKKQLTEQLTEKLKAAGVDPGPYLKKLEAGDASKADDHHMKEIMDVAEKILPGITQDARNIKAEEVDFSKFDELRKKMDAMAGAKKEEVKDKLRSVLDKLDSLGRSSSIPSGAESEKLIAQLDASKQKIRDKIETAIQQIDEPPPLPRPPKEDILGNVEQQLAQQKTRLEEMRKQMDNQLAGDESAPDIPAPELPEINVNLDEKKEELQQAIVKMKEMYRIGAQYVEGKPPHELPMDIVQYRFRKALDKGQRLAGTDLAGVDASSLDLEGIDLSDCYLEYVNFTNTSLRGANLKNAIITHANLGNADLTGANLEGANLGDSNLESAVLDNVNLYGGELSKANLNGAKLINSKLDEVGFLDARLAGVNMSGSILNEATFVNIDLSGSVFIESQITACNFLQCSMENADFSESNLSESVFVECKMDNSKFNDTNMSNVRLLAGCSLNNCDFRKAVLDKANLRDAEAQNSCFEEITFHMADFSGADLQNTKFYGAQGKRALFMKSDLFNADFSSVNLMQGSMLKARLTNANLTNSNFYAVDFMNATVGGTDFTGANLDLTLMEDWRPSK